MKTFSEYQVATTHNSFLPLLQVFDCSSRLSVLKGIRTQLESGIRCLEFDIHEDRSGNPVISHGNSKMMCTPCIPVEDVLWEVAAFMKNNPSPVILDFQLETKNLETQNKFADMLSTVLGKYHRKGVVNFLVDYPEYFMGQVILTCGGGLLRESRLTPIINVSRSMVWWFENRSHKSVIDNLSNLTFTYLRVYPNNYILSRNFDTIPLLKRGIQMVAVNYVSGKKLRDYMDWFRGVELTGYKPISVKAP